MESQPTKRGVPLGYGLANEETDGAYSIFLRTYGCRTCRLHGARKPTSIKAGPNHPNYRHGQEIDFFKLVFVRIYFKTRCPIYTVCRQTIPFFFVEFLIRFKPK